jgi:hypothetical protein
MTFPQLDQSNSTMRMTTGPLTMVMANRPPDVECRTSYAVPRTVLSGQIPPAIAGSRIELTASRVVVEYDYFVHITTAR